MGDEHDAASANEPDGYRTHEMDPHYAAEQDPNDPTQPFHGWGQGQDHTAYVTDAELGSYELSFQDGVAHQEGQAVDTYDAYGVDKFGVARHTTVDERGDHSQGRQIFTMDGEGTLYSGDPGTEFGDRNARFHHSSLAQGGAVAGAGEMQIRDGVVEVVGDQSGHYKPDMGMTGQVLDSLETGGVTLESVGVELGAKKDGEVKVNASAIEVQSYADVSDAELYDPATGATRTPEQLLRERHSDRDDMLTELRARTAGRRARLDGEEVADGQDEIQLQSATSPLRGSTLSSDYTIMEGRDELDDPGSPLRASTVSSDYTIMQGRDGVGAPSPLRGAIVDSDYTTMERTAELDDSAPALRGSIMDSDYTTMTRPAELDDPAAPPAPPAPEPSEEPEEPAGTGPSAAELTFASITGPLMDEFNELALKRAENKEPLDFRICRHAILIGYDYDRKWGEAMDALGGVRGQLRVERARIGAGRVVVSGCPTASEAVFREAIGRVSDKEVVFGNAPAETTSGIAADDGIQVGIPIEGEEDAEQPPGPSAAELTVASITGPLMDEFNELALKRADSKETLHFRLHGHTVLIGDQYEWRWGSAMDALGGIQGQLRVERARIGAGRVLVSGCPAASQGVLRDAIGRVSDKKVVFS